MNDFIVGARFQRALFQASGTLKTCRHKLALLSIAIFVSVGQAQDQRLHRVIISGETKALAQRVDNIDRLIFPEMSAVDVARTIGRHATAGWCEAVAVSAEFRSKQKWNEALAEYLQLIDESGEELVPLPIGPFDLPTSVQLRRLCEWRIVQAPPAILDQYRERLDRSAKKWLDEGVKNRDPIPLRRLVSEFFCSIHTAPALDTLGDLAFERGEFGEALQHWRTIAGLGPRVTVDRVRIEAKQILARIFAGEADGAKRAWAAFQKNHPNAEGQLAGKKGNYAAILESWLTKLEARAIPLSERDWTTFGGSASRNRPFGEKPDPRLWAEGPAWVVDIETGNKLHPATVAPIANSQRARRLRYHPIIVGEQVLVADAESVSAFDLMTGERVFRYDVRAAHDVGEQADAEDTRFTLSAMAERVYARLGSLGSSKKDAKQTGKSYLVCLDPRTPGPKEVWIAEAKTRDGESAVFEGAPLLHEGRAFIAMTRRAGGRITTAIACYEGVSGVPVWMRDVCDVPDAEETRLRQSLLTLAGRQLVYCTESGAIVSLDPASGNRLWAVRYPGRENMNEDQVAAPRDLCPPLFHDGRLFVAPQDSDRILCLDASSGRLIWQRERIEAVHLLGTVNGLLGFNTPNRLQAIRMDSGLDDGGWMQPVAAFGRGFFAGDNLFVPTQAQYPVYALAFETGAVATDPSQLHRIWPGNMAYANDCLVVAHTDSLVAYLPEKLRRDAAPKKTLTTHISNPSRDLSPLLYAATKSERRAWEVLGERRLLTAAGRVVTTCDNELRSRDASGGTLLWKKPMVNAPGKSVWSGDKLIVAAGEVIQAYSLTDGRALWSTALPPGESITELRACGSTVLALQDCRRLHALDCQSGAVLWHRAAPNADFGGRFLSRFYADDTHIVVHTRCGRRWILDSRSGRIAHDIQASPQAVSQRAGRCFIEATDHVSLLDPGSGKETWTHRPANATSLNGQPLRVFADNDTIVLLIPRNHGYQLDRLQMIGGQSLWKEGGPFLREPVHALTHDQTAIYLARTDALECRSLQGGRKVWTVPLPAVIGMWHIVKTANELIVFPEARDEPAWLWTRLGNTLLALPRLPQPRVDAFPVLIHDPRDGKQLARLDFPADSSSAAGLHAERVGEHLVLSSDRRIWCLKPGEGK